MRPLTTPQLFARYTPAGSHHCFYCGGQCDTQHAAADVVRSTFTALDTVTLSPYVCYGCTVAMAEGIEITTADGAVKTNQKTRGYSWIVTRATRTACTKAHRQLLLDTCLSPPDAPYSICISDSGQRHLLYRTPVCWSRDVVTATLEGEPVTYRPPQLVERLRLARMIAAATGKPALRESMTAQTQMRIVEHYDRDDALAAWLACQNDPLSRLAAWLCPPKEECLHEFPGPVPAPAVIGAPRHKPASTTLSLFD
jgi:CRISPR type IV-associated protein Csf1